MEYKEDKMDWYKSYKLMETEEGNTVIIELNPQVSEFSQELLTTVKENILELDEQIQNLIDEKFSDVKVNSVKLMLGSIIVASIPFMAHTKVQAATNAEQTAVSGTGVVTATKLNVRTGPSTNYSIMHALWQGNRVKVTGQSGEWYKILLSDGRTGWVNRAYLRLESSRQQKVDTVLAATKALLGIPYVWGGESLSEGGFDCSGLTQYVFKKAGYNLNRISEDQAKQGAYVSGMNLQPGDLVFYSFEGTSNINHVGIYIGGGKMIHSPKTGDVVKTTDITTSYWESRFVTSRRIIQ
jgi:cell wall-associated NlpC family hydrolase